MSRVAMDSARLKAEALVCNCRHAAGTVLLPLARFIIADVKVGKGQSEQAAVKAMTSCHGSCT
eukprot:2961755-Amphidinium_carterae.1